MFAELKNTIVMRGGRSASKWTQVQNLSKGFNVHRPYDIPNGITSSDERNYIKGAEYLSFTFEIEAAGGGITEVFIKIGIDDFPVIFKSLAKEAPDTAAIFSECTSIAIKSGNKDVERDDD